VNLLLDTHALLWALANDPRLGARTRDHIADPENAVFVSVASLWEIALKVRVGKLRADVRRILATLPLAQYQTLAISPEHVITLSGLPQFDDHKDPFDHLLVAQAIADDLLFVSEDRNADRYGVRRIACSSA
jgi:PIN domain nuclease of toxin-antitoxin system